MISHHIWKYVQISQNWTYLEMSEKSYIFADISDILGYLDLFSDISGVQTLRWRSSGWLPQWLSWMTHSSAGPQIQKGGQVQPTWGSSPQGSTVNGRDSSKWLMFYREDSELELGLRPLKDQWNSRTGPGQALAPVRPRLRKTGLLRTRSREIEGWRGAYAWAASRAWSQRIPSRARFLPVVYGLLLQQGRYPYALAVVSKGTY